MRLGFTTAAAWVAIAGCAQSKVETAEPEPLETGAPTTIVDCAEAVVLSPSASIVNPYGLVNFVASGGSGEFSFELISDGSGATLNAESGAYLAGASPSVQDVVAVTDERCDASAEAAVDVVPWLDVHPLAAQLPPQTALAVEVSGGSGAWTCVLAADGSGATLSAGCGYTSGSATGLDIVRFVDDATGQEVDLVVEVDPAYRLQVAGYGRTWLIAGSPYAPWTVGGSGEVEIEVLSGALTVEDGALVGEEAGSGVVVVRDRYAASMFAEIPVAVVEPVSPELNRDGERSGEGAALALGDVNGDGWPDAALGFIELSVGAYYSGGVAIYAGGPGGLDPDPVKVIGGTTVEETLGRALAVADVDGDGLVDLLVGADKTDRGGTNNGSVSIYPGVAGGFFADAPSRVLYGKNAYARFGAAIATCDFDGDGWIDLAVGAREDADQAVAIPADDQGAVHVFLGSELGFSDEADFELFGVVPDPASKTGWSSQEGMELGAALAASDFDGDGLCDVAAGAPGASLVGSNADGAVLLYRGTLDDGLVLTRAPARVLAGEEDGELGRRLAAGDLDGDGLFELAVSEWTRDDADEEAGAVAVFFDPLGDGSGEVIFAADADWRVRGTSSFERMGTGLDLVDLDGDGGDDLVIGAYRGEIDVGVNEGVVTAWYGDVIGDLAGGYDATGDVPDLAIDGPVAYARMGQAVAGIGDLDADGRGDLLALAGYDGAYGIEAGAPYFLSGVDDAEPVLLGLPGVAAGHEAGQGIAVADLDGDGNNDLLVGSPGAGEPVEGANTGTVHFFDGAQRGPGWSSVEVLGGFGSYSASDRFGYAIADAGDFDGDGYRDLAVVARKDSAPSSFDADEVFNPTSCPDSVSLAGSVVIYRGGPEGYADTPSFQWFTPDVDGHIYEVQGGFDRDGDGWDDLAVGSWNWDGGGGFAVLSGRVASDKLTIVCDAELYGGLTAFDRLGASLAAPGDLDGDGCDELVVGASGEELAADYFDQGVIRVLWGFGGPGCAADPAVSTLSLDVVGSQLGTALAAGGDLDGDGVGDLVVGGSAYRANFAEIGGAWMVPGWWVLEAARDPIEAGALPTHEDTTSTELLPEDGLVEATGVRGRVAGGLFGEAVALVPDPEVTGGYLVAVSAPLGDEGGVALAGGVQLWRYDDADGDGARGFGDVPWGVVSGETAAPQGNLGLTLAVGSLGGDVLVVGAPRSSLPGMDHGAAYVCELEEAE